MPRIETRTLSQVTAERADTFKQSYIPNLKIDCDGRPYHAGTLASIVVNGTQLLVTARHVLDRDIRNECDVDENQLVSINKSGFVKINPFEMISLDRASHPRHTKKLDLVFLKPNELDLATLVVNPIPQARFRNKPLHRKLYMAACGFPESKNGEWAKKVTARPYAYYGLVADNSMVARAGYDPMDHFAIEIDLKRVFRGEEKRVRAPSPEGISGGPVFVVHDFMDPGQRHPEFAGIVIARDRMKKHLICVRAEVVEFAARQAVK